MGSSTTSQGDLDLMWGHTFKNIHTHGACSKGVNGLIQHSEQESQTHCNSELVLLILNRPTSEFEGLCVCPNYAASSCVFVLKHCYVLLLLLHGKLCGRETGRCTVSWRSSGDNSGQRWVIDHRGLLTPITCMHILTHTHTSCLDYSGMQLTKVNTQQCFWVSLK